MSLLFSLSRITLESVGVNVGVCELLARCDLSAVGYPQVMKPPSARAEMC